MTHEQIHSIPTVHRLQLPVRGWQARKISHRDVIGPSSIKRPGPARSRRRPAVEIEAALEAARVEERRRIARDLHDDLGQRLTALSLQLELGIRAPDSQSRQCLMASQDEVRLIMGRVRELAFELALPSLRDLGLVASLRQHCERFSEQTRIQVISRCAIGADEQFAPAVRQTVFRIVQEALTNVARHAGVEVANLDLRRERGALVVEVRDEGRGFHLQKQRSRGDTFGVTGMSERAASLGGNLTIESHPNRGTCIRLWLPMPTVVRP